MSFISISLDICNSTKSKLHIHNQANEQGLSHSEEYSHFQDGMFDLEFSFLSLVLNSSLEISRLFLIKTIGDELWYSYNLEELMGDERRDAITAMIHILAAMSSQTFHLNHSETPLNLSVNITLDTLENVLDISHIRNNYQQAILKKLLSHNLTVDKSIKVQEVYRQLSSGGCAEEGLHTQRPDYIGYEVDRFFKIAKEARNNMILLGPNIMNFFKDKLVSTVDTESLNETCEFTLPHHGGMTKDLVFIQKTIPGNSLKGVLCPCDIGMIKRKDQEGLIT